MRKLEWMAVRVLGRTKKNIRKRMSCIRLGKASSPINPSLIRLRRRCVNPLVVVLAIRTYEHRILFGCGEGSACGNNSGSASSWRCQCRRGFATGLSSSSSTHHGCRFSFRYHLHRRILAKRRPHTAATADSRPFDKLGPESRLVDGMLEDR